MDSMLRFVNFYMRVPEGTSLPHFPQTAEVKDPVPFINRCLQSAEHFHPGCEKLLLTDQETQFPGLWSEIELRRFPELNFQTLILSKLRAEAALLEQLESSAQLIFLDYDILINANLEAVFEQELDVALTFREKRVQIFNGGVLFVKQPKGLLFLKKIIQQIIQYHPRYLSWEGDQIAFLTFIDPKRFFTRASDLIEIDGLKIRLLPAEVYNYTPPNWEVTEELKKVKIIHFKDKRKRFMDKYWEQFLS